MLLTGPAMRRQQEISAWISVLLLPSALMIERQRDSMTMTLRRSSLNSERAKSSLQLEGVNKEMHAAMCLYVHVLLRVCCVSLPVHKSAQRVCVCVRTCDSQHSHVDSHRAAVSQCNQLSISPLYVAELLQYRCPTGKCNYTLLATEYRLHCPICLRRDSS